MIPSSPLLGRVKTHRTSFHRILFYTAICECAVPYYYTYIRRDGDTAAVGRAAGDECAPGPETIVCVGIAVFFL